MRRTTEVYPYDTRTKPVDNLPIVYSAIAYDDPVVAMETIIVTNEGIYYGKRLNHILINPKQVRNHGF